MTHPTTQTPAAQDIHPAPDRPPPLRRERQAKSKRRPTTVEVTLMVETSTAALKYFAACFADDDADNLTVWQKLKRLFSQSSHIHITEANVCGDGDHLDLESWGQEQQTLKHGQVF
jgi:hypothetical protein